MEIKAHMYLNILIFIYFLLIYIYWNNVKTLIRHVGLRWGMLVFYETSQSLRSGMWVSDGSPIKHVKVSEGSPIKHVGLL